MIRPTSMMLYAKASPAFQASQFPVTSDATGRFMIDARGAPFMMCGDGGAQGLCQQVPTDVENYLQIRSSQGFNTIQMHLVMNAQDGANNTANGSTHDGIVPWTGTLDASTVDGGPNYDVTTLNPSYLARIDYIINRARSYGMLVILGLFENDSYLQVYQNNGNTRMASYAATVAARYASFPNVIYQTGNDFQTWNTVPTDNTLAQNVMSSVAANDTRHLQCVELDFNMSGGLNNSLLVPYQGIASAYTYFPVYYQVGQEYASGVKTIPTFLIESYYEGLTYGLLTPTSATTAMLRRIAWWTTLSGGLGGYLYGSKWFDFGTGWQAGLVTTAVAQLGIWKNFFASYNWSQLVPDTTNVVVTSGFGTATGNNAGRIDTDTYVTTARVPDGSLVISFVPGGTSPVVDMTKLRGTVTARWFDPTTAVYTAIGSFANTGSHTFTNPGNNSAGDPDQVLVLTA